VLATASRMRDDRTKRGEGGFPLQRHKWKAHSAKTYYGGFCFQVSAGGGWGVQWGEKTWKSTIEERFCGGEKRKGDLVLGGKSKQTSLLVLQDRDLKCRIKSQKKKGNEQKKGSLKRKKIWEMVRLLRPQRKDHNHQLKWKKD